jgi:hypothetical protein
MREEPERTMRRSVVLKGIATALTVLAITAHGVQAADEPDPEELERHRPLPIRLVQR